MLTDVGKAHVGKGVTVGAPGLREPGHPAVARPKAERKRRFGSGGLGSLGAFQKPGPHHDADTPNPSLDQFPQKIFS